MNKDLLNRLAVITAEEKAILEGRSDIDRSLYYRPDKPTRKTDEIDAWNVLFWNEKTNESYSIYTKSKEAIKVKY